jgi:hypothetical protein
VTKTELISAVRDYLNRPNITSETISSWLSIVTGELNRALREHPRNLVRALFTQPAGSALIPLPTDLMAIVTLRQGRTIYRQYPATAIDEAEQMGNAFVERGTCLELYPTPSEDTNFTLDYHAAIAPFTDDFSSNWVSLYFPDIYLYGALKESAVWIKSDQRLVLWQSEFTRRVDELAAQGWNQNVAAVPTMVPA